MASIRPLIGRTNEQEPDGPVTVDKKPQTKLSLPPTAAEALVIHTLTLAEPERPRPEAADSVQQVSLKEERPNHTV